MKVRATLESGITRVHLIAEGDAEMRMLGVLGTQVAATVHVRYEGHSSYAKVASIEVTLMPETDRPEMKGTE